MNKKYQVLVTAYLVLSLITACTVVRAPNSPAASSSAPVQTPEVSSLELPIAVPTPITVVLLTGSSYSGTLESFSTTNVSIKANDRVQEFLLSTVGEISFHGDVWFSNSDGSERKGRIRGISQTFSEVPISALTVDISDSKGSLNLINILNQEEYSKLTDNTERLYAVRKLIFDESDTMIVKINSVRK